MKRIYEEYLHVPEEGKIKEKVFIMRIAVAIVCMVCCLSAMGFSAYAYFTSSITSGTNTIQAASYRTEIIVANIAMENQTLTVEATKTENAIRTYALKAGQKYKVTITALGNASKGYCKIVVGDVNDANSLKYFTIPMSTDETESSHVLEFTITCYEDADVHIITNWGGCSETDAAKLIEDKESDFENITIGIMSQSEESSNAPVSDDTDSKQDEESDNTNGGGQEDNVDSDITNDTDLNAESPTGEVEQPDDSGDVSEIDRNANE